MFSALSRVCQGRAPLQNPLNDALNSKSIVDDDWSMYRVRRIRLKNPEQKKTSPRRVYKGSRQLHPAFQALFHGR